MIHAIPLDENYSTTRLLTQEKPIVKNNPEDSFETVLFLPQNDTRKGEGGLRAKGYFKNSYEDKPLISIITVVYNGEKYLEETILSVINQTYDNVEYVIIDGGSTDGTLDIIKKYEDKIDYWVSEKDCGIYDAMNKGILATTGDWVNFMNAGDILYDNSVIINVVNSIVDEDLIYSDTYFTDNTLCKCDIKFNKIIHQSLIYKKVLHKEFGLYLNSKGISISDYLFFVLCKNKKWKKVDFIISKYDINGVSSNILHYKQRIAIDILFNNMGRFKGASLLIIHPLYNKIKRFLNGR
jgi:glycosyltransferase involved in cell wall biosynthesis